MLPMPATNSWSISRDLSPDSCEESSTQNFSQLMMSSSGSNPRWANSGRTGSPSAGAADTNSSPKVLGSTKRSWPPWVKVITAWVWGTFGSFTFLTRWSWPLRPRWMTRVAPSSSTIRRYLPARLMAVMLWPSSWARKALALACRLTVRPLRTSTDLILRLTTSPWRSLRMVSTSGSSGIPPASLGFQRSAGRLGGNLLGVLLGATLPRTEALASNVHRGQVPPTMIGSESLQVVPGNAEPEPHGLLLQPALVIRLARLAHSRRDPRHQHREDQLTGGVEAGIEVHGTDHGLHGVGQDRDLGAATRGVLALAESEVLGDAQLDGHLGQDVGVHHGGPDLGQHPVGQFRVDAEGVLGHDQSEDGAPQVLEPLVGGRASVLGAPGPVGQRLSEQLGTGEPVAEPLGEPPVGGGVPRVVTRRHRAPQAPSS